MRTHLEEWIGGNPWEVVPLHGLARIYVTVLGLGSIAAGVLLAIDPSVIRLGWLYGVPSGLVAGGLACLAWALRPEWRLAYAAAGALIAASYLMRGALAVVTLVAGTTSAYPVAVGAIVYPLLALSILAVWRHLAPVIRPRRPPECRAEVLR